MNRFPSECLPVYRWRNRPKPPRQIDRSLSVKHTFCLFSHFPTFWCVVFIKRQRCQLTFAKAATAAYAHSICTATSFLVAWLLPVILFTKCRSLLFNKLVRKWKDKGYMKVNSILGSSWRGALWVYDSWQVTYRVWVEANEAVVVASLLCLLTFVHPNGRRVEETEWGYPMKDVAPVSTVVLFVVVRARQLVWTGWVAQQTQVPFWLKKNSIYIFL